MAFSATILSPMTSANQNPVPNPNNESERKGMEGASAGGTVAMASGSDSKQPALPGVILRFEKKMSMNSDMLANSHPINMYGFRRNPNKGKLSLMNPKMSLNEAGRDRIEESVVC